MAISIDESTKVISVEQSDLTFVSGTLYELDTNAFRIAVKALLAAERHVWMDVAVAHNGEVTVAGTTFARAIELINGYSITFENLSYSVRLAGSNNNLFDVDGGILNTSALVTVIAQNAAGLISAPKIDELHQDAGLTAGRPKVVTENTADTDYTEVSTGITKTVVTVGSDTTVTRT